jgi:hypothetical protein
MKYWLTTQWPPRLDSPRVHEGVWLQEGKEDAGRDLRSADLVFIYETKTGRRRQDGLGYWSGRQGIVALVRVVGVNLEKGFAQFHEVYSDGDELLWKMVARTRLIDSSHFCQHDDVCDCLGYSRNYFFRGFGRSKSGLKELSKPESACLRGRFR